MCKCIPRCRDLRRMQCGRAEVYKKEMVKNIELERLKYETQTLSDLQFGREGYLRLRLGTWRAIEMDFCYKDHS